MQDCPYDDTQATPPPPEYFTQSSVHVDQGRSIFKMARKVEGRP